MPEWTADAWALGEEALTVTALKVARRRSSDRFGRPAAPTEPVLSCQPQRTWCPHHRRFPGGLPDSHVHSGMHACMRAVTQLQARAAGKLPGCLQHRGVRPLGRTKSEMGSFAFLSFIFCSGFVSRKWPRGLQPGIFFFFLSLSQHWARASADTARCQ